MILDLERFCHCVCCPVGAQGQSCPFVPDAFAIMFHINLFLAPFYACNHEMPVLICLLS
jgi:hypothetical protein